MKKLIIIPAYNEAKNLEKVINNIKENVNDFNYVIINDCSTDNTIEVCKQLITRNDGSLLNLPTNLGIGGCVQTGYIYAKEQGYDIVVQMDGDGQHDAKYLNSMVDVLVKEKADMVIGSRFINKEGYQSSKIRRIGSKILRWVIFMTSKNKITDPTSGFRMMNRDIIENFCLYYPQDYPEPESIVHVLRKGYKIVEVPVQMKERIAGKSSINILKSVYYMIKVSLAIFIDALKGNEKRGI